MTLTNQEEHYELADFWAMLPGERESALLDGSAQSHAWHYPRNKAYRHTVGARGVGPTNKGGGSLAVGAEGEGLTTRFLRFATACGACGVTEIRTVGRGAFPQLAYSWEGLIPLDLVAVWPAGRLTTIEFDRPHDEMLETHRLFLTEGRCLLGQDLKA